MSGQTLQRAHDHIADLTGQGLDLASLWRGCSEVIAGVIPHYQAPCWFTMDPTSLLVTSHFQVGLDELPPEWLAHEYYTDDFHKMADVARSERGASTLHEATGGDPSRSIAWNRYIRPHGGDQELVVALRTRNGAAWGVLSLYREPDRPQFSEAEIAFLRDLAPSLAEGARRGLLFGESTDPEGSNAPGLVILRADWSVESLTPGVERWLEDLPDSQWATRGTLPPAVLAVAGRALRSAEHPGAPGEMALARVLSRSGRWMVLHGASLLTPAAHRIAVIIEPAHPARISALLMAAYGLTDREQDVTRLVLQGDSTAEIATRLHVSPQTVQQHLKSVFDKTGVRSRRDLVGKVFYAHYEPRLRDNEQRVLDNQPMRGGPLEQRGG